MEKELVTVIMSVYNSEKYLKDAIESIINQTYKNIEFLITDDCSNDTSLKIIQYYEIIDKRIKVIRNIKNKGLTKSLNNMIVQSTGTIIARMDSDDIAEKNRIEIQVEAMKIHNADIVFSNVNLIDFEGNEICIGYRPNKVEDILKFIDIHNYIPHPTVIYKTEKVKEIGMYSEACYKYEDLDLWRKMKKKKFQFWYVKESLLKYRINPNSVRSNGEINKYFKLANICIVNKNKRKAISYWKKLNLKEKLIIGIKLTIPFKAKYLKSYINNRKLR